MLRLSKPFGFLAGILLGIYTRDCYIYPYPLRVQDLEEDYKKIDDNIKERSGELEKTVNRMSKEL